MRGKKVVYEGKMTSLRRVKDNVDEVGPMFEVWGRRMDHVQMIPHHLPTVHTNPVATIPGFMELLNSFPAVSATHQVTEGTECGLGCDDFLDWAEGDKIDCYLVVSKARRLEEAKASTAVDLATLAG